MVAWKNQREHYREQGIPGQLSGRYTTSTGVVRGSWCLQIHIAVRFLWEPNVT